MAASMEAEERFETMRSPAEECVGEDELLPLLHGNPSPICLDSFEPSVSGSMDIWQAVGKVISVNKMVSVGCRVKILMADQRTGVKDRSTITAAGRRAIEVWKALGPRHEAGRVEFLWCSEETDRRALQYWPLVLGISRNHRVGWLASLHANPNKVMVDQLLEPIMKCADILLLQAGIFHMSVDQTAVSTMAREYCEHIGRANKPIFLLHHMLPGFKGGQQKMSESDPSSAIFMEDTESEVEKKINKAFCPMRIAQGNPCLEYIERIVFPLFGKFEVVQRELHGGNRKTYLGMKELRADYGDDVVDPPGLKSALAEAINKILQQVRDHFEKNCEAEGPCNTVKKEEQPR